MEFPASTYDNLIKNTSVDEHYAGNNFRELNDEEIEDLAQEKIDSLDEDELRELLECVIYSDLSSDFKARLFEIKTEVKIND